MRTASLVLGIVGGVIGIIAGFFALTVGSVAAGFEAEGSGTVAGLGFAAIFLAILGIIGGALAIAYPRAAAICQIISCIGGFIAVSLAWIISGPLLLVGALLAFFGRKGASSQQEES